jgi:hypothetical protein
MKYQDPKVVSQAEELFEKFFKFGFFGREALVISVAMRRVGYTGGHQTFHRYIWKPWLAKKEEQHPEMIKGLMELQEELKNG